MYIINNSNINRRVRDRQMEAELKMEAFTPV